MSEAFYHVTRPAAVLQASGADAFTFLQSQFSNDLNLPEVERAVVYGLWLDRKGKIHADSFVIRRGPADFLLVSYDCPAATIRAHLEAHIVADEVELRDLTNDFSLLHAWPGEPSRDFYVHMEALGDPAVCESWLGRRPTLQTSWDFLLASSTQEWLEHEFAESGIELATADDVQAARIIAGVPAIPSDAGPGDLPQEGGLERDAVSFDKGCYLGQEVMARLQTQGHVNRGLWQVGWSNEIDIPASGVPVPLFAGTEAAGELRSRVTSATRGLGLAMLKSRLLAEKTALSLEPNGPAVINLVKNLAES